MIISKAWGMRSKLHAICTVVIVTVAAVGLGIFSLYLNNFAVTPDIAGLVCAGDHLAQTGTTRYYARLPGTYEMCWEKNTYPLLQYTFAGIERISGIDPIQLALGLTIVSYVTAVWLTMLVTWQLSRQLWLATLGASFALFTPALIRSLLLTPQNTIGYGLVLLVISCLLAFTVKRQWLYSLPVVIIIVLSYFTHTLTFGIIVLMVGAWFLLVAIRPWWLQLSLAALAIGALGSQRLWHWLPASLDTKLAFFLAGGQAGFDHPLWDHAAIWGYGLLALGAVGFFLWPLKPAQRTTLAVVAVVSTLLGHLSIFGLGLLPNRFIPFTWLALTPLAALGAASLVMVVFGKAWNRSAWSGLILGVIMTATAAHGLFFMVDDLSGLAVRYTPRPGYEAALTWLNEYDGDAIVLGVQSASNQEVLISAMWYDGVVRYYPWYALNHRNLQKFTVTNKGSSPYANVVTNPNDPQYQWLHDYYLIVAKPNSAETTSAIQRQTLSYFITSKNSKVYTTVWSKADPGRYSVAYENEHYIIYDL